MSAAAVWLRSMRAVTNGSISLTFAGLSVKSALSDRKIIDRAKGILMKVKNLSEEEAYSLMRSTAMREKKKIVDIAQSIITAAEMLK